MRPVRLDVDGFASYRDPATVDFTDVDFFVLVGPTGSGKSTIIDAITFALYGLAPRWEGRSKVSLALAPTATRGTVRLVFDVAGRRYVVARELRRMKQGVTQRSQSLELLADPTGTGTAGEAATVLAADSAVTGHVEELLGLTFEHFCQCVVLPQNRFAEFLQAKPSDRQAILLALLGAQRYDGIAKAANTRAQLAETRAETFQSQLAGYADVTEDAVTAAQRRVAQLEEVGTALGDTLRERESAARTAGQAQEAVDALVADIAALGKARLPGDLETFGAELTAATAAVEEAQRCEDAATQADADARKALRDAPDRDPLLAARRHHAERATLTADMPVLRMRVQAAAEQVDEVTAERDAAAEALDAARTAAEKAAAAAASAEQRVSELDDLERALTGVRPPPDVEAVATAYTSAVAAEQRATTALETAEQDATATRSALDGGVPAADLRAALSDATDLVAAQARLDELTQAARASAGAVEDARGQVETARRTHEDAAAALERAQVEHQAAALREHLTVGAPCPVCCQDVTAVPDAPAPQQLRDARAAEAAAIAALRAAEQQLGESTTAAGQAAAQRDAAADTASTLRERLEQRAVTGTVAELTAALTQRTAAESAAQQAEDRTRHARRTLDDARTQLRAADQGLGQARAQLTATRDPLVAVGAPAIDGVDVAAAWERLTAWADDRAQQVRTDLGAARQAHTAAQQVAAKAATALEEARAAAATAATRFTAAVTINERALAAAQQATTRLDELDMLLEGAPADADAADVLEHIAALTEAASAADATLRTARAVTAHARTTLAALDARARDLRRALTTTRDTLVRLGAPEVDDTDVVRAWEQLHTWAAAAAEARAGELEPAREHAATADAAVQAVDRRIIALLSAADVALSDGPVPTVAPQALHRAAAAAVVQQERLTERRDRAADLRTQQEAAVTDAQVARTLGRMLRADQFPRWLVTEALDTLVVDASRVLTELSGGQFELTHRDGEFFVVDHADADAERSVRTLSGGETFQASLALALALSEHLSAMAGPGRAQLDSIFLDEGFGTLDAATLEVVAATLENLAHTDRMVGVVTHVPSLAERIPVRYVVHRDHRSSRVVREGVA